MVAANIAAKREFEQRRHARHSPAVGGVAAMMGSSCTFAASPSNHHMVAAYPVAALAPAPATAAAAGQLVGGVARMPDKAKRLLANALKSGSSTGGSSGGSSKKGSRTPGSRKTRSRLQRARTAAADDAQLRHEHKRRRRLQQQQQQLTGGHGYGCELQQDSGDEYEVQCETDVERSEGRSASPMRDQHAAGAAAGAAAEHSAASLSALSNFWVSLQRRLVHP